MIILLLFIYEKDVDNISNDKYSMKVSPWKATSFLS